MPLSLKIKKKEVLDFGDSSLEAVSGGETRDDRSRERSRGRDSSPPLVTNGDAASEFRGGGEGEADTLPTDMSDTSDSEDKPTDAEKCTHDHTGKQLMRGQFPFNIDQLFTMIFTNSKFNLELLAARGITDYVQAPWQVAAGVKCRQVSYVLGLSSSGPIGPKEVHITETQIMNKVSKPGHLYSIDATSENSGIPYADYFTVEVHYCLSRLSEHVTDFTLHGHVKYKKTVWPMIRAFLEKNTMSGLEDYGRLVESRLLAEAEGQVPAARKSRRHRRANGNTAQGARFYAHGPPRLVSSGEAPAVVVKSPPVTLLAPRVTSPRAPHKSTPSWLALALLLLLALNALLYWRLYYPLHDLEASRSDDRMKTIGAPHMADWSALLDEHTKKQRGQLLAWREALDTTVNHLHQTELALRKLLETIEPSLAKAENPDGNEEQNPQSQTQTQDTDDRTSPPIDKPRETRGDL